MAKLLEGDAELDWPVVATVNVVHAAIEVHVVHAWLGFLKQSSVAVAGRLVVFVYVQVLGGAHLISGLEVDFRFIVTGIVTFFYGFEQLVVRRDHLKS